MLCKLTVVHEEIQRHCFSGANSYTKIFLFLFVYIIFLPVLKSLLQEWTYVALKTLNKD